MTTLWRLFLAACATGLLHLSLPASGRAQPQGKQIFQKNCASCHTIGEGKLVGPDLKGVASRRDPEWIARWIDHPRQMVQAGDSLAVRLDKQYQGNMVSLGLSPEKIAALMEYFGYSESEVQKGIEALKKGTTARAKKAKAVPTAEASVAIGRKLFTGERSFTNGGPSCQTCHSYAGLPALGGGTMGPDLTNAYDSLGRAVITWPQSQPPMRSIYSNKPLTKKEKAHLLAFLKAGQGRASQRIWTLLIYAVGGAALLFGLMAFIWRDRLREVRRPMLRES